MLRTDAAGHACNKPPALCIYSFSKALQMLCMQDVCTRTMASAGQLVATTPQSVYRHMLCCLLPAACCPAEPRYTYNIPVGQPLEASPGYSLLLPMTQVSDITITQAPVTWKVGLQVQRRIQRHTLGRLSLGRFSASISLAEPGRIQHMDGIRG
jgi:hypothetical protein